MFKLSSLAVATLLAATGTAQAVTYDWVGDTTGAPTYNRALAGFSGLSGVGTAVRYQTLAFSVTASGSYDFLSSTTGGWDNFTFLYGPSFNPASALVNGLAGNDDFGGLTSSGFTAALTAGASYVFVTTGFANTDFGAYSNSITGPGTVNVVPEPGSYGLMALGLALVGFAARRSRT